MRDMEMKSAEQTSTAPDWRHHASCRSEDPETFFPVGNTGPARLKIARAKTICASCPVHESCLQWACESGQNSGIWGGLSEEERGAHKRSSARHAPHP